MRTVKRQIISALRSMFRPGESRHAAKISAKDTNRDTKFEQGIDTIHSYKTLKNYLEVGNSFCTWVLERKGVDRFEHLENLKIFAQEYVQERYDNGYSAATVKRDVSALNKIFHLTSAPLEEKIQVPKGAVIRRCLITRSRGETAYASRFSREKNKSMVTIARAYGLRREDLMKVKLEDFFAKDGILLLKVKGSKGGRDRISICDPEMQEAVTDVLNEFHDMRHNHSLALFEKISKHYDVHRDRRAYANSMMEQLKENIFLAERLRKAAGYKPRHETRTRCGKTTVIRSEYYICKDGSGRVYSRDYLYIVSKSLGHNRINIIVTNYL